MPEYRVPELILDFARNAVLVDAGVLIAAFYSDEDPDRSYEAQYFLEVYEGPLLIPIVVVVEVWGWLVGSRKDLVAASALLTWLNAPNRAIIIPLRRVEVDNTQYLIESFGIDCVDAMLAELATFITEDCDLRPALPIATFDTGDFLRMYRSQGVKFSVYDVANDDLIPLG
jgi:predicted nucleic acid-binding protein